MLYPTLHSRVRVQKEPPPSPTALKLKAGPFERYEESAHVGAQLKIPIILPVAAVCIS